MVDYYKILDIHRNSSSEEIKRAYRQAALYWHPDKNKSSLAQEKFVLIHEAYTILIDASKRKIYDNLFFQEHSNDLPVEKKQAKQQAYDVYSQWADAAKNEAKYVTLKSLDNILTDGFHFLNKYGLVILISFIMVSFACIMLWIETQK